MRSGLFISLTVFTYHLKFIKSETLGKLGVFCHFKTINIHSHKYYYKANKRLQFTSRSVPRIADINLFLGRFIGEGVCNLQHEQSCWNQTNSIGLENPAFLNVELEWELHDHGSKGVWVSHLCHPSQRSKASLL